MTRNTLLLLQSLLYKQTLVVGADDVEINAVLTAKRELTEALEQEKDN